MTTTPYTDDDFLADVALFVEFGKGDYEDEVAAENELLDASKRMEDFLEEVSDVAVLRVCAIGAAGALLDAVTAQ